jgi:hypothetical protein
MAKEKDHISLSEIKANIQEMNKMDAEVKKMKSYVVKAEKEVASYLKALKDFDEEAIEDTGK